uniref:Uncharacterized protein n=1 Tax=Rhizophora mucronata TaxID=61149 RepID=A0A2P2NDV5_RHIMU
MNHFLSFCSLISRYCSMW